MSARFKYEELGALQKAALTLTSPLNWRAKAGPWIFDNVTGVRLQLSGDEDAVLRQHAAPTVNGSAPPKQSPLDPAFDRLVLAIMEKRRGYGFDWHRLVRQAPHERASANGAL